MALADRSEAGLRALAYLRAIGVRLVLDDFGTGWSSLAYLRQLPLDTIKIDRSFVTDLGDGDRNVAIVQAVLSLAHGLGVNVAAGASRRPNRRSVCEPRAATSGRAMPGPGPWRPMGSRRSWRPGRVSACCRRAAAGTGRG